MKKIDKSKIVMYAGTALLACAIGSVLIIEGSDFFIDHTKSTCPYTKILSSTGLINHAVSHQIYNMMREFDKLETNATITYNPNYLDYNEIYPAIITTINDENSTENVLRLK